MWLARTRDRLFGALKIEATGEGLEKLLNAIQRRGIVLWDIKRVSETRTVFKLSPNSFNKLRPLTRHSGIRLRILRKSGLPFQLHNLKKRKGLVAGLVVGCALIYALSSFVWIVDVQGNNRLSKQEILQSAANLGLKTGMWRKEVDTTKVARELKENLPKAAWVGVSMRGTRVLIEVVEKVDKPEPQKGTGSLIADKTGLVTDVLVLKGTPLVKAGQMVKQGQQLISANNLPAAQGFVRARVWYTGFGEAKLKDEGTESTGNTATSVRIKIGTKVIILTGKQNPFSLYKEETEVKSLPSWRNISIPVEVITVHYQERSHFTKVMSREEALKAAQVRAEADLEAKLPPGVKVVNRRVNVSDGKNTNLVRVNIEVETLEEIAVHQGT